METGNVSQVLLQGKKAAEWLKQQQDILEPVSYTHLDVYKRQMVYHSLNGSALRRIEAGIRHAKQAGADGAVWFGPVSYTHLIYQQILRRSFLWKRWQKIWG